MLSTGSATCTLQCSLAGHQQPTRLLHSQPPRALKKHHLANGKWTNWPILLHRICLPILCCSGGHKGHQQHPSLAQLLLEGSFILFSWLLGHKEESQADFSLLSSQYFHSTASLQALNLPVPRKHQPLSLSQNSLEHRLITFLSAKQWGSRAESTSTSICNTVLRLQMSKSKASKQQRGPERSLLCFLPAMADIGQNITTALLDYVKVLETGDKDGLSHGRDFLMRSPAGL